MTSKRMVKFLWWTGPISPSKHQPRSGQSSIIRLPIDRDALGCDVNRINIDCHERNHPLQQLVALGIIGVFHHQHGLSASREQFTHHTKGNAFKKATTNELGQAITEAAQEAPKATDSQRLPRDAKDSVKEYFQNLGGQNAGGK